ncbi:MAG TPA: filamentous hemagglutinin family protein [Herbaspirillum sp.]|jgi:filamentous hemagglutinin family protein
MDRAAEGATESASGENNGKAARTGEHHFRLAPVAQAIALVLAAGGVMSQAHAQQAFSANWFAAKGAVRNTVASTGLLPNGKPVSSLNPNTQVQQAAAQTQKSFTDLGLAAQSIAMQQARQSLARQAAMAGGAGGADGLGANGLDVDTNSLTKMWLNAQGPTQTVDSNGQVTVDVKQTAQKSILSWQNFDIGKNTILNFDQAGGNQAGGGNNWVVLNRINSGMRPSTILGSIKAQGSVYVLNRNGVIFGNGSQVNVNSLITSSLNLFSNDMATSNKRFLNGGIGDLNPTNFATNSILLTSNTPGSGNVTIGPGATITTGAQGLALFAAPNVTNSGTITAPGGQVALVAGVGVSYDYNTSPGPHTQGASDNTSALLRFSNSGQLTDGSGNDITPVGVALNDGLLYTPRGNITMVGGVVQQNGAAVATTSVAQSGSIFIAGQYEAIGNSFYTGAVNFGTNALTAILPDGNGVTLPGDATSLAPFKTPLGASGIGSGMPSQGLGLINIVGQAIDFQGGSLVYAPGQTVSASTMVSPDPRASVPAMAGAGRVLLESGATIDVAGLADVQLAIANNILTVRLAGNELADSPLQQGGVLNNTLVTVDLNDSGINAQTGEAWIGTPLANLSSYANLVQHSINQLLINGGAVYLSGSEIIGAPDSTINVMGGYLHYLGGMVTTTRLVDQSGALVSIGSADPYDRYVSIAGQFKEDHARWGFSETWSNGLVNRPSFVDDYVQGGNAGVLNINVTGNNGTFGSAGIPGNGAIVLNSTLLASNVMGSRQGASGSLPGGGALSFSGISPIEIANGLAVGASLPSSFDMDSPLLATAGSVYTVNVFDGQALSDADFKSISLTAGGIISGAATQSIKEDAGATLTVQPGGSITLTGNNVTIGGALTARGGAISITTQPGGSITSTVPGDIEIGSSAVLDVSGFLIDERTISRDQQAVPLPVNAGSIKLIAGVGSNAPSDFPAPVDALDLSGNLTLAAGSLLDLRGGGHILRNGQLQLDKNGVPLGTGGSLALQTNGWTMPLNFGAPLPQRGILTLDGTIDALGFNGGGALTLGQAAFQIGGDATTMPAYATYFDAGHWGDLGFGTFNLISMLESVVPDGATVVLHHRNLIADNGAIMGAPGATHAEDYAGSGVLIGTQRSATNLAVTAGLEQKGNFLPLTSGGSSDALEVGQGAQIIGEPGANISLGSYAMTDILGAVKAPGGVITVGVNSAAFGPGAMAGPLYLGPDSVLDVSGTFVENPIPASVYTAGGPVTPLSGKLLAGGVVNLNDIVTTILVAPGALIDVAGATGALDVAQVTPHGIVLTRTPVWSDGGQVNITAAAGMLFEGSLVGNGGGPQAAGGTLTVTAGAVAFGNANLILVQNTAQAVLDAGVTFDLTHFVPTLNGPGTLQIDPAHMIGGNVLFGADSLDGSDFDNLVLNSGTGMLGYTGQVSLNVKSSVTIDTTSIVAANEGNYIWGTSIGGPNLPFLNGMPRTNGASLTVSAPYVAINGSSGDISGLPNVSGRMNVSDANLTVNADQIDLAAIFTLQNIAQATFNSSGDIRLLPAQRITGKALIGYLASGGNLAFNAADVYPATDTAFVLQSFNRAAPTTISFGYPGNGQGAADGNTPLSAGGTLLVSATNIVQNGKIQAPFGSIILGTTDATNAIYDALGQVVMNLYATSANTKSVVLGSGSVTSVSANGMTIPFGNTLDQASWTYNPALNNPDWVGNTTVPVGPLTQAPQGIVTVKGDAVAFQPGAVVDISGGGDLQAQEWIPGTGGSRDVLGQYNTSYAASKLGTQVPLYPDARQVYAIVPGYNNKLAPYDPTLAQAGMVPGQQIYLAGGPGLPAGYYTLLPARYATLPGAFRVVANSGVTNPLSQQTYSLPDGTMEMTGYLGNSLSGARDAAVSQFMVQSESVWGRYSQYVLTGANAFFPNYAALNKQANPYIPDDAGRLVLSAKTGLSLGGSLHGDAVDGGTGSQVDISSQFIQITGSNAGDQTIDAGYLGIDAAALSSLGAQSLLIGGTRSMTTSGTIVTPTANGIIVSNDAGDPLTGPEVLLVAAPQFQQTSIKIDALGHTTSILTPVADTGLVTLRSGSVVEASGDAGTGAATHFVMGSTLSNLLALPTNTAPAASITNYYAALAATLGTLVEVSNGTPDTVQLPSQAQISPASITVPDSTSASGAGFTVVLPSLAGAGGGTGAVIESGAQLAGGNALTLVSTGDVDVQSGAAISGTNIAALSSSITFVGAGTSTAPVGGMAINAAIMAELAQAQNLNLQSYGAIAFQGDVDFHMTNANAQLTLGGGSLSGDGGQVSIGAPTLILDNTLNAAATPVAGTGSLSIEVGRLIFGAGAKSLAGFGTANLVAHQAMIGQDTGSMDFGALPLALHTPVIIADTGSTQTIRTSGALSVVSTGDAVTATDALGGAITLQGGSVMVSTPVEAQAGNITLKATAGDVTMTGAGQLVVHGVAKLFRDMVAFASGGAITLSADHGTVNVETGALVDFAGAALGGNGGDLSINTTNSTAAVQLNGIMLGSTAAGFNGSILSLDTSGAVGLDDLARVVAGAGITGGIGVHTGQGDLVLNDHLHAGQVSLVADGGSVIVNGLIDASGMAGGTIQLYGSGSISSTGSHAVSGGVTVNGSLLAKGNDPGQLGGTVEIGTSGNFDPGAGYNGAYGYENIAAANAGTITLGANAVIDVSGGTRGGQSGGTILLRAPLLEDQRVNVVLAPTAVLRGARSVSLESYATWSTADATTGAQHFDGLVDPAGWYSNNGALLAGSFKDAGDTVVASWDGNTLTNSDGSTHDLNYYLTNDYFAPTAANTAHASFYGYVDGDNTTAVPGTLMGFVRAPGFAAVDNTAGIANFQRVAGIELDNPVSAGINNGDIRVLSNWNLGAEDASGNPVFRTNGLAPHITFRAGHDVAINASITDGFHQIAVIGAAAPPPPPGGFGLFSFNDAQANYGFLGSFPASSLLNISFNGLSYDADSEAAVSAPAGFAALGLAGATSVNGYYGAYNQYFQLWINGFITTLSTISFSGYIFDVGGFTQSASVTNALAAANAAYTGNIGDYANYLSGYSAYLTAYSNWVNSLPSGSVISSIASTIKGPPQQLVSSTVTRTATNSPALSASGYNSAAIAGMSLAAEPSSTSYRFTAGANTGSPDPLALNRNSDGDVIIDGHTDMNIVSNSTAVIAIPTVVRTGTGSIDIAAAGNFELLDHLAPGAVYTAGTISTAPAADASAVALGGNAFRAGSDAKSGVSTILTAQVNPDNAGNITLTTNGDIIGFQNVTDSLAAAQNFGSATPTGLSGTAGAFVGQFWNTWLLENPASANVPWYVNFGSFDQGIMSVGGNITVRAGGDIRDLGVSLPTTAYLDGANALHVTGGGNLSVTAGGNIYSGSFYVGKGSGSVEAGGTIASDFSYTSGGQAYPVATMLAVQYGTISVDARQSVDIGGVYNPTYIGGGVASYTSEFDTPVSLVPFITSMNGDSGVFVQSSGGSLNFNSMPMQAGLFSVGTGGTGVSSLLLPAALSLVAVDGDVTIGHGGGLYPSTTGTLTVLAAQSVNLAIPLVVTGFDFSGNPQFAFNTFSTKGNITGTLLGKLDYPVGTGILPTASDPGLIDATQLAATQVHDPAMAQFNGEPVRIYALEGSIIDGRQSTTTITGASGVVGAGTTGGQITLMPNAPAQLYAGLDIVDLPFYGENLSANDITSLIAGRDISYNVNGSQRVMAIELAGPGTLDVEAGRNINFQGQRATTGTSPETGIRTLGNSVDVAANPDGILNLFTPEPSLTDFGNPYLPPGGASVSVLFGVAPGLDRAAFIEQYIDPANAGAVMPSNQAALIGFVGQYERAAGNLAGVPQSADQAWSIFQTLPAAQQQLLVGQVFNDVLNATGLDYNNPASQFYQQYARGYQAINTLFPAGLGYTANNASGNNGANRPVATGDFDMRNSTVQTQQGGNISVFGPGGRILVGSSVASPATNPGSEGILTLEQGSINTFTDGNVLVAQSRIMTEQGGNVLMWSSNGNLDAGKGSKTSVSAPPPLFACDIDFYCVVDIKGAVSGAGIAVLQSLPDVPAGDANLIAPRGTVDFGAAGVRTSGNLNVAALIVANAANAEVQGKATGLPALASVNISALTDASAVAAQAISAAQDVVHQQQAAARQALPSIFTVRVLGFGNEPVNDGAATPSGDSVSALPSAGMAYDLTSPVQLISVGDNADAGQMARLSEAQRRRLQQNR